MILIPDSVLQVPIIEWIAMDYVPPDSLTTLMPFLLGSIGSDLYTSNVYMCNIETIAVGQILPSPKLPKSTGHHCVIGGVLMLGSPVLSCSTRHSTCTEGPLCLK